MAYFSTGEARNKLMILLFIKEADCELTRNQLFRVFAEQNWMDYFEFQAAITALEEDTYVAAIPCAYGQGYRVTSSGESMLEMFIEELPTSLRESMRKYARDNKELLRAQTQFFARQTELPDGGYLAMLRLMDKNATILELNLQLPTAQIAQAACDAWPDKAQAIYQELINKLL
ncbi:DUF4364 family protein [Eubacteriales bacterium OttesenSCG-928-K08]|nr:DUF4364 family protein [Eubacteriales bacterium OttesenSCG-928-K08]